MPFRFSEQSLAHLESCARPLQDLFFTVIEHWDCTIIEGYRSDERQIEMLRTGMSTLGPGESKHNRRPSAAVDVGPYYPGEGIPWDDFERFRAFGGFVLGVAAMMQIRLRWGGDWDGDRLFADQSLHDLPHFELLDQ